METERGVMMQKMIVRLGFIALIGLCGCGRQPEEGGLREERNLVKKETGEAMAALSEYAGASKEQMQAGLENLSQKLNGKLDELSMESSEQVAMLREELNVKQRQVSNALIDLKTASADQWERMKQQTGELAGEVDVWLKGLSNE
jgi:DNA-binding transcriptional regulator YiaG